MHDKMFHHLLGEFHESIDPCLESRVSVSPPHEPQLEDVVMAAALYRLVAGIVHHVVVLVRLEQVRRLQRVTGLELTLKKIKNSDVKRK